MMVLTMGMKRDGSHEQQCHEGDEYHQNAVAAVVYSVLIHGFSNAKLATSQKKTDH